MEPSFLFLNPVQREARHSLKLFLVNARLVYLLDIRDEKQQFPPSNHLVFCICLLLVFLRYRSIVSGSRRGAFITMSGPTLNPEPALPEEREKLNLPPKSYADAAEETPESPDDGSNENNENRENGVNGQTAPSANGTGKYEPKHKVSVLRIVDTNGSDSTKSADEQDTRPSFDRQESKREYSATVCAGRSLQCFFLKANIPGPRRYPEKPSSTEAPKIIFPKIKWI